MFSQLANPQISASAVTDPDSTSVHGSRSMAVDLLLVMAPTLALLKIQLAGELYIAELLIVGLLPVLILIGACQIRSRFAHVIVICGIAWLLSQTISDHVNVISLNDRIKGTARIVFFIISFLVLCNLIDSPRRALLWTIGSAIPLVIRPFIDFSFASGIPILWKFGLGQGVVLLACLPLLWRFANEPLNFRPIVWMAYIHLIGSAISFYINARSFGASCLFTSLLIFAFVGFRGHYLKIQGMVVALIFSLLTAQALSYAYSQSASLGFLGEESSLKYREQVGTGASIFDVIVGGRSEFLVSFEAISDAPILGHGSWAKDYKYTYLLQELRRERSAGEAEGSSDIEEFDGLIPTHSYLFGAWVESGLAGGLFWIYVLLFTSLKLTRFAIYRSDLLGILLVIAIPIFIWNIFFSPFGGHVRLTTAALLAIFSLALHYPPIRSSNESMS